MQIYAQGGLDKYQVGLGPEIPLLFRLNQYCNYLGQSVLLESQEGSSAEHTPGQSGEQLGHLPDPLKYIGCDV